MAVDKLKLQSQPAASCLAKGNVARDVGEAPTIRNSAAAVRCGEAPDGCTNATSQLGGGPGCVRVKGKHAIPNSSDTPAGACDCGLLRRSDGAEQQFGKRDATHAVSTAYTSSRRRGRQI